MVPRAALVALAGQGHPRCEWCTLFSKCDAKGKSICEGFSRACFDHRIASSITAAAEATGQPPPRPTDTELLNALQGCVICRRRTPSGSSGLEAWRTNDHGEISVRCAGDDPRDLARAILAQRGGGTDADQ
jgi:hypothetical protein